MAEKSKFDLYNAIAQRYYRLQTMKQDLMEEKTKIVTKFNMVSEEMDALENILCSAGTHEFEHFRMESVYDVAKKPNSD